MLTQSCEMRQNLPENADIWLEECTAEWWTGAILLFEWPRCVAVAACCLGDRQDVTSRASLPSLCLPPFYQGINYTSGKIGRLYIFRVNPFPSDPAQVSNLVPLDVQGHNTASLLPLNRFLCSTTQFLWYFVL